MEYQNQRSTNTTDCLSLTTNDTMYESSLECTPLLSKECLSFFYVLFQCLLSFPEFANLFKRADFNIKSQQYFSFLKNFVFKYQNSKKSIHLNDFSCIPKYSETAYSDIFEAFISELYFEFNKNVKNPNCSNNMDFCNYDEIVKLFRIHYNSLGFCHSHGHLWEMSSFSNSLKIDLFESVQKSVDNLNIKNNDQNLKCNICSDDVEIVEININTTDLKYLVIYNYSFLNGNEMVLIDREIYTSDSNFRLKGILLYSSEKYLAYCKKGKNWIKIDDYSILIDENDLPKESDSISMLFYEKF